MNVDTLLGLAMYATPMILIWALYGAYKRHQERSALAAKSESEAAGLTEPTTLHPLIDPVRCRGCGACVAACPEQPKRQVLGLIDGKAQLVNPTDCIGHGACQIACPFDAITLVFGTESRGVEIPVVAPDYQSNVPGLFIAGELGGMGLIRNAIEQGVRAVEGIATIVRQTAHEHDLDLLIVGAGPAGFAAALAARQKGLRYLVVEQESLGGTVYQFPRGKLVMTQPADLPLVGPTRFTEISKEELLEFWRGIEQQAQLQIRYLQHVEDIRPLGSGFEVKTNSDSHKARCVLLAVGRRGTPRKLEIPGEDLPKVVYRLIDPEQYRGQRVLIVGGGDSALEAAHSIAAVPETSVTLSYRGSVFNRAKPRNRKLVEQAAEQGRLEVLLETNPIRITADTVELKQGEAVIRRANDAVIVNAGGILPTAFLKRIGVAMETKYGTR